MKIKNAIPEIGFGTFDLRGKDAKEAISTAIDSGYRLFDTASSYGNEMALKRAIYASDIPRADFCISTKLWNSKRKYTEAIESCKQSLKRLGLGYIDLFLVHWPASPALYDDWRDINSECWRAMETLKKDGIVKNIGVCNYLSHHLDALLQTASVIPVVNQIELHPGFLNLELINYCNEHNIKVMAWSPLGEGALLQNEILIDIAEKYKKTVAQICLRWCIQHGAIPLPKSKNPERIKQNFDVWSFSLDDEEMDIIDGIPFSGGRGYNPDTITIYG